MEADTSIEDFEDTRSHFDPSDKQHTNSSSGEEEVIIPHPLLDDPPQDTVDVVVPPTPPSPPIPPDIHIPVHDPPAVMMAEGEDPMAAFKKAIVDAFQEANRNSTYPMPSFAGKKGEKPEDHTLRFEDYIQHYDIALARQSQAFVKTLTGKARVWADTTKEGANLPDYQVVDPAARADVEKSLKHLFLTRFAVQGRTPKALHAEWQNLTYDPAKDDIEDFVRDIKKLAEQLGYGDTTALMAIRGALPLDLQNLTVNMNDLETVKKLLIKIFDNLKIKQLCKEGTNRQHISCGYLLTDYCNWGTSQ